MAKESLEEQLRSIEEEASREEAEEARQRSIKDQHKPKNRNIKRMVISFLAFGSLALLAGLSYFSKKEYHGKEASPIIIAAPETSYHETSHQRDTGYDRIDGINAHRTELQKTPKPATAPTPASIVDLIKEKGGSVREEALLEYTDQSGKGEVIHKVKTQRGSKVLEEDFSHAIDVTIPPTITPVITLTPTPAQIPSLKPTVTPVAAALPANTESINTSSSSVPSVELPVESPRSSSSGKFPKATSITRDNGSFRFETTPTPALKATQNESVLSLLNATCNEYDHQYKEIINAQVNSEEAVLLTSLEKNVNFLINKYKEVDKTGPGYKRASQLRDTIKTSLAGFNQKQDKEKNVESKRLEQARTEYNQYMKLGNQAVPGFFVFSNQERANADQRALSYYEKAYSVAPTEQEKLKAQEKIDWAKERVKKGEYFLGRQREAEARHEADRQRIWNNIDRNRFFRR